MTRRELLDAKLKRMAEEATEYFVQVAHFTHKDEGYRRAHLAGSAALADILLRMAEVLERYEPVLRKFGCAPSGDHDDPSWCTPSCNDYGKQCRKALAELDRFLGEKS